MKVHTQVFIQERFAEFLYVPGTILARRHGEPRRQLGRGKSTSPGMSPLWYRTASPEQEQAWKVSAWNSSPVPSRSCGPLRKIPDIAVNKTEISPLVSVRKPVLCHKHYHVSKQWTAWTSVSPYVQPGWTYDH